MMNQVLRKEKKFLLQQQEFFSLKNQIGQVLPGDSHNGPLGYPVRSLYFDTIYDKDYFEKLEGVELRRKIRLRCYSPDSEFAMLEMKQKQGDLQLKRSLKVEREDAKRLAKGDYSPLLKYSGERGDFALECYGLMNRSCYLPKTIVEYQRMAYIAKENRIRITFDQNIASTESSMDLFSPKLLMNPVMDRTFVVLEVKYNNFLLGYIQQILNGADRSEVSVSKFYLARQNAYRTHL